ncbi:MAG: hypothetical protein AAGJ68_12740 [Pseudomonadota bacterium]
MAVLRSVFNAMSFAIAVCVLTGAYLLDGVVSDIEAYEEQRVAYALQLKQERMERFKTINLASVQVVRPESGVAKVVARSLIQRSCPRADCAVVGVVARDSLIEFYEAEGEWIRISPPGASDEAWISRAYTVEYVVDFSDPSAALVEQS